MRCFTQSAPKSSPHQCQSHQFEISTSDKTRKHANGNIQGSPCDRRKLRQKKARPLSQLSIFTHTESPSDDRDSAIRKFKLWSMDTTQAFVQSNNLTRPVYLITHPELDRQPDEVFQLVKPLYGLSDASDYWYVTLRAFICDQLHL